MLLTLALLTTGCDSRLYTLTRVEPEFAGDNCAEGGIVVHEGVDNNRDGELADDEIDDSSYICNGDTPVGFESVHQGDFVIQEPSDLDDLAGIDTITGDLVYVGVQLDQLVVPGIKSIGGRVIAGDLRDGTVIDRVELPDLEWLGGGVQLDNNPKLETFVAPNLTWRSPEFDIRLVDNPLLSDVSGLDGVTEVGQVELWGDNSSLDVALLQFDRARTLEVEGRVAGDLVLPNIVAVDGLVGFAPSGEATTRIELAALTEAGGFAVAPSERISAISAPALQTITGPVDIQHLSALEELDLSSVESIGGDVDFFELGTMGGEDVAFDDPWSMPALTYVGGRLKVQNNAFTSLGLPALEQVDGPMWFSRNHNATSVDISSMSHAGSWKTLVFAFEYNNALTSIEHPGTELYVDAWFVVAGNPLLEDLVPFMGITGVTGTLQIENNPLIDACEVQALIDAIGEANIEGDIDRQGSCR